MKDPCIRKLLKETELLHYSSDAKTRIVEELNLPVAGARVDIAVINGSMHGYEIKSASDTLKRLTSQVEAYSKVFDFLSVVTEEKYRKQITAAVPRWVGLIICSEKEGNFTAKRVRRSKPNKKQNSFYLARLLWRDELIEILTSNEIAFKRKDRNWILCESLAANLPTAKVSAIVRQKLKDRKGWRSKEDYAAS